MGSRPWLLTQAPFGAEAACPDPRNAHGNPDMSRNLSPPANAVNRFIPLSGLTPRALRFRPFRARAKDGVRRLSVLGALTEQ